MPLIFSGRTVFAVPQILDGFFHDDVAVRDQTPITNDVSFGSYNKATIDMFSDLDEDILIQIYGSRDDNTYFQLGSDITLVSGGSSNHETLDDHWDYLRVVVTAQANPTSGNCTVGYSFLG